MGNREIFIYRERPDSFYKASVGILAPAGAEFKKQADRWTLVREGHAPLVWDPKTRTFETETNDALEAFQGFDTYWYIWSLTNKETKLEMAKKP